MSVHLERFTLTCDCGWAETMSAPPALAPLVAAELREHHPCPLRSAVHSCDRHCTCRGTQRLG